MGFHPGWPEIAQWIDRSEQLFLKKLSRNDSSWADDTRKHQSGFFIPGEIATSGYFPRLRNVNRMKPHIWEASYLTFWPASAERKESAIKHYSNKGGEYHHTRVPKDQFIGLTPASLLLSGKLIEPQGGASHWFVVIDSASQEAEIIENAFGLEAGFHYRLYSPREIGRGLSDAELLLAEIEKALKSGTLARFVAQQALPSSAEFAAMAQKKWLDENSMATLDPYLIKCPGDAVMRISRDIEYALYRAREMKLRAAEVAQLLARGNRDPIRNMVLEFAQLDAIFLSAAQTRKSRAGRSFEHHMKRLLQDGRVRHEEQVVLGGRRPDFVLPDVRTLNRKGDALVVSLKTTLRERWKQVGMERLGSGLFLATVDDRVSGEVITEMGRHDICLLVPESLKSSKETDYKKHGNVITFRQFFDDEVRRKRPMLVLPLTGGLDTHGQNGLPLI
jgi:hypothetical protein